MVEFNFPVLNEKDRYKIRLAQHAEAAEKTIEEYINESHYNYVILSNADEPQHWADEYDLVGPENGEDETNWVVYGSREEAEIERHDLIDHGDHGNRVVTERYFLKLKGLI
jgi:hypothetical protein